MSQPHSLEMQVLAELGLVGALALLVFVGALVAGFAMAVRRRGADVGTRSVIVAGAGMVGVWLLQGAADWLHLLPGITAIALCGCAALLAPPYEQRERARGPAAWGVVLVVGLAVLFCAFTIARITLAEHNRSAATDVLDEDPRESLRRIEDALALQDDSLDSLYVRAAALARLNDYARARATLLEAAELSRTTTCPGCCSVTLHRDGGRSRGRGATTLMRPS